MNPRFLCLLFLVAAPAYAYDALGVPEKLSRDAVKVDARQQNLRDAPASTCSFSQADLEKIIAKADAIITGPYRMRLIAKKKAETELAEAKAKAAEEFKKYNKVSKETERLVSTAKGKLSTVIRQLNSDAADIDAYISGSETRVREALPANHGCSNDEIKAFGIDLQRTVTAHKQAEIDSQR